MALRSTQPLTEMSTRNLPAGKGRPVNKADNLTTICEPNVQKILKPQPPTNLWASTACYRDSFYQPRSNLVKDKNGDLLADCHDILNRRKNYFSRLLNVHRVIQARQIEIHTVEPLIPDSSSFEVEIVIAKLERYKSPGSDKILAELVEAGGETLWSDIYKLINSIRNKEDLRD
jgi:hypothetical protein